MNSYIDMDKTISIDKNYLTQEKLAYAIKQDFLMRPETDFFFHFILNYLPQGLRLLIALIPSAAMSSISAEQHICNFHDYI